MKWFHVCFETPAEQASDEIPTRIYVEAWDFGAAEHRANEWLKKAKAEGDFLADTEVSIIRLKDPAILKILAKDR